MKKVWLVVTQYRDVDEYEDKEILADFHRERGQGNA